MLLFSWWRLFKWAETHTSALFRNFVKFCGETCLWFAEIWVTVGTTVLSLSSMLQQCFIISGLPFRPLPLLCLPAASTAPSVPFFNSSRSLTQCLPPLSPACLPTEDCDCEGYFNGQYIGESVAPLSPSPLPSPHSACCSLACRVWPVRGSRMRGRVFKITGSAHEPSIKGEVTLGNAVSWLLTICPVIFCSMVKCHLSWSSCKSEHRWGWKQLR